MSHARISFDCRIRGWQRISTSTIKLAMAFLVCAPYCFAQVNKPSQIVSHEASKIRRQVLKPLLNTLKAMEVPFDPNLLLEDSWREKLEPTLQKMPEMSRNVHITGPMSGVYFASLLTLPQQVELVGDTVMLVRELAPEDENSTVTIEGPYRLVIFVVGNQKKYQIMRRRPAPDFLHVNVGRPCGIVGIPPVLRQKTQCIGMAFLAD